MILYLVRHATAVPHGTHGVQEDQRPLTEEGIRKMKQAAGGLRALGVAPELILSSPLPRARQTAEILLDVLGSKIPMQLADALAPGGERSDVYKDIQSHRMLESLMLVGHQPSLGEIAGEIASGSSEFFLELKKGGACALHLRDLEPRPRGDLLWLVTPAILRAQRA